jgi:hypothetical protein
VGSPLSDDAFAIFSIDGSRIATIDRAVPQASEGATFGITVADGSGDMIFSRRYEYEPVPVSSEVVDDIVDDRAARLEGAFPDLPTARAFIRENMFLPESYPPVTSAAFSDTGTLWVRREATPAEPQRWVILDQDGEPLGETTLPEGFRVHLIRGDSIWGSMTGDEGEAIVVRYRLEGE